MLQLIRSWLRDRQARVVGAGAKSEEFNLSNMCGVRHHGNAFFNDSEFVLRQLGFCGVVYADDYNAFQVYPRCAHNLLILSELREFQRELHKWGRGNKVKFDAAEESFFILSVENSVGDPIRLLGVKFDGQLRMTSAICKCVDESNLLLRT